MFLRPSPPAPASTRQRRARLACPLPQPRAPPRPREHAACTPPAAAHRPLPRALAAPPRPRAPPISLTRRAPPPAAQAAPSVEPISEAKHKAKVAEEHAELEPLITEVLGAGSLASLLELKTKLVVHFKTEAAGKGGINPEHTAHHKFILGLIDSEIDRIKAMGGGARKAMGGGARASSDFLSALSAAFNEHEAKFDEARRPPPLESPRTPHASSNAACPPRARPAASLAPPLTPLPPARRAGRARRAAVADAAALDRQERVQHADGAPLLDALLDGQEGQPEVEHPLRVGTGPLRGLRPRTGCGSRKLA